MVQQYNQIWGYMGHVADISDKEIILTLKNNCRNVKMCLEKKIFPEDVKKGDVFEYYIIKEGEQFSGNVRLLKKKV